MLLCLRISIIAIVVIPPIAITMRRLYITKVSGFPVAVWGSALFLAGFLLLPWLNLQPLKYINLDWLFDFAPPLLEMVFKLIGLTQLSTLAGKVAGLDMLFHPRGWLTLLLVSPVWMWVLVLK